MEVFKPALEAFIVASDVVLQSSTTSSLKSSDRGNETAARVQIFTDVSFGGNKSKIAPKGQSRVKLLMVKQHEAF